LGNDYDEGGNKTRLPQGYDAGGGRKKNRSMTISLTGGEERKTMLPYWV